jgi:hypothetical protein
MNNIDEIKQAIKMEHDFKSSPVFRFDKLEINKPVPNELHPPFNSFHLDVGDTRYFMKWSEHYEEALDHRILYEVTSYKPNAPSGERDLRHFEIVRRNGEMVYKEYFESAKDPRFQSQLHTREGLFCSVSAADKREIPFIMSIPSDIKIEDISALLKQRLIITNQDEEGAIEEINEKMTNISELVIEGVGLCVRLLSMVEQINSKEYRPASDVSRQVRRQAQRKGNLHPVPYIMLPSRQSKKGDGTAPAIKHRFRYRVRGHWRQTEKKKVWVKAHERGLGNLICVQKEYIVADL